MDMGTSSMAGMSGMDMSSMSMPSMTSMAMSAQPSATASASHAMSSMGGMGSMSMDMGGMGSMSGMGSGSMGDMHGMDGMDMGAGACKMSMVGNWNTIDTCILSPSWHIKTHGQFAGSCIGIFMIVVLIEVIRRLGREWDRYVVRTELTENARQTPAERAGTPSDGAKGSEQPHDTSIDVNEALYGYPARTVRSLIYAVQFMGAYLVMLMAMTFNGYIIMSICLGGLFGHFISTWDSLAFDLSADDDPYLLANGGGIGNPGAAIATERRLVARSQLDRAAGKATDACYGHGTCC